MQNATVAETVQKRSGVLYPVMLIAAISLIVFSAAGIATMMGWLPSARSDADTPVPAQAQPSARTEAREEARAPVQARSAPVAKPSQPRVMASAPARCDDCGTIESIRAVEVQGEGSGMGAIGGAVVGGLLGNQVGRGRGRTAATVVGAGAGAYAGHEIEKNVKKSVSYQVRVRMGDGTIRTYYEKAQPAYAVGQKVRVTEQGLVAAG